MNRSPNQVEGAATGHYLQETEPSLRIYGLAVRPTPRALWPSPTPLLPPSSFGCAHRARLLQLDFPQKEPKGRCGMYCSHRPFQLADPFSGRALAHAFSLPFPYVHGAFHDAVPVFSGVVSYVFLDVFLGARPLVMELVAPFWPNLHRLRLNLFALRQVHLSYSTYDTMQALLLQGAQLSPPPSPTEWKTGSKEPPSHRSYFLLVQKSFLDEASACNLRKPNKLV